jgi:hypothetical protein
MITLAWYHDNMLSFLFFLKTSHTDWTVLSEIQGSITNAKVDPSQF